MTQQDGGYFVDAETVTEMTRLLAQDTLITRSMGGLFPERTDHLEGMHAILDVACGPGGWVLEAAREYPHIQITGIDISERSIQYARASAQARDFSNAHFKVMDILKPLDLPDASFDLVNARTLIGIMTPRTWPVLVREMVRVCRPGGTIRLTEFEMPLTNSPATEKVGHMVLQALHKVGRLYSPDGNSFTITPMLGLLLREAGCQNIQEKPHLLNFSAGTEAHEGYTQDLMIGYQLVLPFLTQVGITTKEEYEPLHQQMVGEMLADTFRALGYGATVWGTKA
ncbi:MAG TPA: methyltransferase domain-containing protein [Ktedonobacteraceae bacterium]|nr:methyltransferase domain-containing protein [Ktedonobacteraceae bacterium]